MIPIRAQIERRLPVRRSGAGRPRPALPARLACLARRRVAGAPGWSGRARSIDARNAARRSVLARAHGAGSGGGHQCPGLHEIEVLETDGGEIDRCQESVTVATVLWVGGEPDPDVLGRAVLDDDRRPVAGTLAWDRGLLGLAGEGPCIAVPGWHTPAGRCGCLCRAPRRPCRTRSHHWRPHRPPSLPVPRPSGSARSRRTRRSGWGGRHRCRR